MIEQYIKQPLQQCCIGMYGGTGQCVGPLLILQYHVKSKMCSISLFNYPENRRLKKKCLGHKMCAMFISKTFVFRHVLCC